MKRGIDYSNFIYLGNFKLSPPQDEYVSSSCWYYFLEKDENDKNFINKLIEDYENSNLRKARIYTKEGNEEFLQMEQKHIELLYFHTEQELRAKAKKKEKFSLKNGWGPDLYECDLAINIEDDFTELYNLYMERKITNEEFIQEMIKRYKNILDDPISGPVFWIILADQQIPNKLLTTETKSKALESIKKDLKNWKGKDKYSERKEELDLLKEDLEEYDFKSSRNDSDYMYVETKVGE